MSETYSGTLQIVEDASPADVALLEAHLDTHNKMITGIDDARLLSVFLRDASGALYAGIHGHTWGGTCQIKLLWVAEDQRLRGLGTALLESAEKEAVQRGCHQIMLSTHSFQAPAFYERHGFSPVATIVDNPAGHADILMLKRLLPASDRR